MCQAASSLGHTSGAGLIEGSGQWKLAALCPVLKKISSKCFIREHVHCLSRKTNQSLLVLIRFQAITSHQLNSDVQLARTTLLPLSMG